MKSLTTIGILFLFVLHLEAQIYFPPKTGTTWDTVSATQLGWCASEKDTLIEYLDQTNTHSFMILHKGKIVTEEYFNGFHKDSAWYWASSGKSLTAFLVGMAQEQNLFSITDKTSDYLGNGWTVAPQAKEDLITIKHQLSMTTGLDYQTTNQDCLIDTCLKYKADAGQEWYYYNAPYRLLQDVVANASGKGFNLFTTQNIKNRTGMTGLWFNYIFFSNARSMARFGLLNLANGIWDGDTLMKDTSYFSSMARPSQTLNPAYGYLWWLNGSNTYQLPGSTFLFNGMIVPNAPADMYMAAGKNDQRIYIVPSLDLVVVRQGNAAYASNLAISQFDNELWGLLNKLMCNSVSVESEQINRVEVYPNPSWGVFRIEGLEAASSIELYTLKGELILSESPMASTHKLSSVPPGIYILMVKNASGELVKRCIQVVH